MILPLMTSLEQLLFTPSCSIPNLWTREKNWLWQFHTHSYFFGRERLPFSFRLLFKKFRFTKQKKRRMLQIPWTVDICLKCLRLVSFGAFFLDDIEFFPTPNSPPKKEDRYRILSCTPLPSEKRRSLGDIAKETTISPARTKMKNAFPGNLRMTCLVCNDKSWCKSIFFV